MEEIPKKHSFKENIFKRLINFFTKKKRQIAFVYIASYMFNSDGSMDEPEMKLLELFLNNIKLKQEEKNALVGNLKQRLTLEELAPKIKNIRGDLRALVFAWQCVMQDGQINQTEIDAFTELSKLFKVDEAGLEKIKHKATKFAHLKDSEMLEEYFKS
ncbi:MAG: TerB family tellurite resistance protein [Bacteroidetes bacterium]|nr:TerB family tellurite resistance protein [Bacteroidota bacterium]